MSKITLEQINKYLTDVEYGNSFDIKYGKDFSVNVKSVLTEAEKRLFINRVVENSYVENIGFSPIDSKIAFVVTFAQLFTDLPIPVKKDSPDMVDIDKLCLLVNGLNLIENAKQITPMHFDKNQVFCDTISELEMCIKQEIDFKNQKLIALYASSSATDEAIESFSAVMHKGLELIEVGIEQLDKNGNRLFKSLTPKKINQWLDGLKKTMVDSQNHNTENNTKNKVLPLVPPPSKKEED